MAAANTMNPKHRLRKVLDSFLLACLVAGFIGSATHGQEESKLACEIFAEIYDGWSVDEVLLQDELFTRFMEACERRASDGSESDSEAYAWALINARKAGKLSEYPSTKRRKLPANTPTHVAEMAARFMEDKHRVSMDRVLCSSSLRSEFDETARSMAPDAAPYDLRKAALGLRKARKLRPELVLRIADWGREIFTVSLTDILDGTEQIPDKPGIYLFRDATGYLYIGESKDLRKRIQQHLDLSEKSSLRNLFRSHEIAENKVTLEVHAFGEDTKAKETRVRRAYESELIASRKPRFNLRP